MGLRSKIILALLVLALVPLAVTTGVVMKLSQDRLKLSTKEYRLATAEGVVAEVANLIDRTHSELGQLGAALSQEGATLKARMGLTRAAMLSNRYVRTVSIYDPDGVSVEHLRVKDLEARIAPPKSLEASLRGVARTEGQAYLGMVFRPKTQRSYLPVVLPMYRGEAKVLYGYLWSAVDLDPLSKLVKQMSKRRFEHAEDRVYILNDALRVVAHGSPQQVGVELKGEGIASGIKGGRLPREVAYASDYTHNKMEMLGVLVPMPEVGWGVVVEQPRGEAYRAVETTWHTAAVIGALFAVVAMILGLIIGRRLAAPVLSVASAAREVAGGNFDVRVKITSDDEVGEMARAFNTMAADLRAYREQIMDETRIRTELSRYLNADLVEQVVEKKAELKLGGQRQQVTVLFADVVSFTPMAEKFPPEFVVGILNELFSFLTEIVFKNGGTVDKFIGDCVMAVFGAPYTHEDDPLRAVRTAEEMHHWLEVGNAKWRKDLGKELQLAVGINSGEAVVGNIGSKKRMEYTVIGDAVNVAARLEALARPGQVLMTADTRDQVAEEFDCVSIGHHQLSGKGEKLEIFALEE